VKVLVIGRSGQLAQALIEAGGPGVIAAGRPDVDLTNAASLDEFVSRHAPDVVVNAAAYTAVDKAESEPDLAHAINATGALRIAQICNRHALPLIHVSTDYVFDGTSPRAYREDDPVAPLGAYGRSKLEGEQMVAASCARHVILRTAWVYSPWGNNFVKTMLRLAATRSEIGVVDDQIGNPTYAPHLATAILAISRSVTRAVPTAAVSAGWGIYHAAGTGDTTWCGFAREVFRLAQIHGLPAATVKAIATADYPTPARRPANSRLDLSKLTDRFGVGIPAWQIGADACVARLTTSSQTEQSG
jgi:dTDP-4-dehydrorhamnose reductase